MIKNILSDVGGVLHSNEMEHVFEDMRQTLDVPAEVFQKVYDELLPFLAQGKILETEFWDQFFAKLNKPKILPEKSLFLREYEKRFRAHHDVLDLMKMLKEQGHHMGILSDTINVHRDFNTKHGLYDLFSTKIFSNEVGLQKPDPKIFLLALEKMRAKAEETVFIDDLERNIEAAKKLGIHGILFVGLENLKDELRKLKVID